MNRIAESTIARSIEIYHGDELRNARLDALYRRFVGPSDLAFDIGAHVGDRVSSFRRLGARVVAVEPQPELAGVIRRLHVGDPDVVVREVAVGDTAGTVTLRVNSANPTVTTASDAFVAAADGAVGWEGQVWDSEIAVPCMTLDGLIAEHGTPHFAKIDVEGFEDRVLGGLSRALPALSFEFTTIARAVAQNCLDRIAALGAYSFDVAMGESAELVYGRPVPANVVAAFIRSLPPEANSGDVYAWLG